MTTPPRKPADVAPSARAVAKHLDRRQLRRKLILYVLLIGTIIFAVLYLRCGLGWGLGGSGKGDGEGSGSAKALVSATVDAGPKRCAIFIAPEGITVDGVKMTRDEAVTACKATTGADVIVAGDTRRGDWNALKAALEAAKIEIFKREPSGAQAVPDAGSAP